MLMGPAIMYSANTVVFTAAALWFMVHNSPRLTLYAFLPLPIVSVTIQYFGRRIHERFERIQAMFSDISARAQENFSGARVIRAYVQEEAEIASFETANQEYVARSLKLVRLMGMLWPTLELMLGLALVLVLWMGGREVLAGRMQIGAFTAFNIYMMQLTFPIIALGWVVNIFQRGTASLGRLNEILQEKPAIRDETGARDREVKGEIEFRGLNFGSDWIGKEHPGQFDSAHLRCRARDGSGGRPANPGVFSCVTARQCWIRAAGNISVQRSHSGKHCAWRRVRHRSGDSRCRRCRQHCCRHRGLS
jgi:ATP-binding cassette subfamily B protein